MSARGIARWRASGKLYPRHPGVYAYGHASIPIEGELVAALIYAGPGAVLSHGTAAWRWGLLDESPRRIEISTHAYVASLPDVAIHQRRRFAHTRHRRFPVTTVAQTLLDLAAGTPLNTVRNALAKAEYLGLLDVHAVEAVLGRGRPGAVKLRSALERHQPRLAAARSRTERTFLLLWEKTRLPMPEVNVRLHGWTVDFLWRAQGLVVETDGWRNHHTPAQVDRDRRKDLALRVNGLTVNRYSRQQAEHDGEAMIADVVRTLGALGGPKPTAPSAARGSR